MQVSVHWYKDSYLPQLAFLTSGLWKEKGSTLLSNGTSKRHSLCTLLWRKQLQSIQYLFLSFLKNKHKCTEKLSSLTYVIATIVTRTITEHDEQFQLKS